MHLLALALAVSLALAQEPPRTAARARSGKPTAAEAKAFVAKVNDDLKRLWIRQQTADWVKVNFITDDTEHLSAWANEEVMAYLTKAIKASLRFDGVRTDPPTARALHLLRVATSLPAPSDPAKRSELAAIAARLEAMYGKGKWCGPERGGSTGARTAAKGEQGASDCRDLEQLRETMRTSRDPAELLDAWAGWHTISPPMRKDYARLVELSNEGAREIGFSNLGELWRAGYDMTPAQFEADTDRLWNEVKPLYDQLHCYVRGRLQEHYGKEAVPDGKPLPAHLLGNMWAQEWGNVYPIVEPYKTEGSLDVDGALRSKGYDAQRMVRVGEGFYTSIGLDPLPPTFWERSLFVKPRDREVVCHASAWDVSYANDLRVKMCIKPTAEDLVTIHHELGHDYYFHAYYGLPALFQQGANDGFHEAIGDAIALSVTPAYLKKVGILDSLPPEGEQGIIDIQMREALDKIAFLPFGLLIDKWRWDVFAGKVKPADYNAAWWALRRKYQGVDAPVPRSEADFDPGAKYHVPANVPYTRYFLARIYQFQFYRALCKTAGHEGPLHTCSIYGNKEAGKRLEAMLALGASRPWPEAMEALTGQRKADATAILDYFAPLRKWLEAQNRGRACGW